MMLVFLFPYTDTKRRKVDEKVMDFTIRDFVIDIPLCAVTSPSSLPCVNQVYTLSL